MGIGPDGSKIAFVSDRDGGFEIFMMESDGSDQTQLTFNNGFDVSPRFIGFITGQDVNGSPQFARPINAEINSTGDVDFYKFVASAGQNYVIETLNLGPNMDSFLVQFDTDGVTELDPNDEQGNLASRIEWTAPSSSTCFVMVRHFEEEGAGT